MNKQMEDAVRFISNELKEDPELDRSRLIEEAARRFDLTPLQGEFLINKYILNS